MNNPNCTFCNRDFSLSKIPYELPCGHSYCRNCLHSFCKKSENEIKCLKEEKLFTLNISKVPISNFFLNYIEPLRNNHLEKNIICRKHNNAQISFICDLHNEYLCSQCSWDHCDHKERVRSYSYIDFLLDLQKLEAKFFEMKENLDDFMKRFADIKEGQSFADEIRNFILQANDFLNKPFCAKIDSENIEKEISIPLKTSNIITNDNDFLNKPFESKVDSEKKDKESNISLENLKIIANENDSLQKPFCANIHSDNIEKERNISLEPSKIIVDSENIEKENNISLKLSNDDIQKMNIPIKQEKIEAMIEKMPMNYVDLKDIEKKSKDENMVELDSEKLEKLDKKINNIISHRGKITVLISGFQLGYIPEHNLRPLCESIKNNNQIQFLGLNNNGFGSAKLANVEMICEALQTRNNIISLQLKANGFGEGMNKNFELFCNVISKAEKLIFLSMSNNKLCSGNIKNLELLCQVLCSSKQIQEFEFKFNDIGGATSEHMKIFCNAIKNNKSLFQIALDSNNLVVGYTENFKELAEALKANLSLRKISLTSNQFEAIKSGEFNHNDENRNKTFLILRSLLVEKKDVEILLNS